MSGHRIEAAAEDEVFIGNVDASTGLSDVHMSLQTARLGEIAYDIEGRRLPHHRPVFIRTSEEGEYDRLMMARFRAIRGTK